MKTLQKITESSVEEFAMELLEKLGYEYCYGPDISPPDGSKQERPSLEDVVLKDRLEKAIGDINPNISDDLKEQTIKAVLNMPSQDLVTNNEYFHNLLVNGVDVQYMGEEGTRGDKIWLIDFENPKNNDFVVCNQFTVIQNDVNKRPDIVLFVNGLPLVVIELKNPIDEDATVNKAYDQLQNYKHFIPNLFHYNSVLIASDGIDAKAGSLTAAFSRFLTWKSQDKEKNKDKTIPQLETLVNEMLNKDVLLDLIRYFTVFEKEKKKDKETGQTKIETVKKLANYHQYYAVNKAIESTKDATAEKGSRKIGVIWHTQGSGKSLSMVFYSGKIVQTHELKNPTIVVLTDRNDLDDQLFDNFAGCKTFLRQEPVQAENREHLKKLLKVSGGGIVFTTIQKFLPEEGKETFDKLSDRENIIVIADEAHRSQYGFKANIIYEKDNAGKVIGSRTTFGFAKYTRDALPNASFIGFTGTPIEKDDISTPAVFGDYIDIYDISQAVEDKSTVKIFYESRLVKVHLDPIEREKIDEEIEALTEGDEEELSKKIKWKQLEAIVGDKDRIKLVAEDIVKHFEERQEAFEGKAMIVAMTRKIACQLYKEIVALKPGWHSKDKKEGQIKVVITSSSTDKDPDLMAHATTKDDRKDLANRFKDAGDKLKLVIVRDMWLTGFDVPCLHTMYVDKPMRGHNLMQAIARVNRVYKDKPGGLIVDYIGIANDLKQALVTYTESGGEGEPTLDQAEAVASMLEKHEIVLQMFEKFDYKRYFKTSDTRTKLSLLLEAQEYILGLENGKERYIKQVTLLSKAFALSVPHPEAMKIKEEVGFFQGIKARLNKFEHVGKGKNTEAIDTAIKQIIDKAIVTDGIVDVFDAAGIKKPDISILSDEFLEEIKGMEKKNIALELLKKLLNDEIKIRSKRNLIQSKKMCEILENAIKKYQTNLISSAEVIEELIKLAKEIREADKRGEEFGLSPEEIAFYDALANNDSAKKVLGDEVLRELARVLIQKVKSNLKIDWTIKENVRANLRVIVKRTLRQYGYPPDMQKLATENVLKQAEMLADEWTV